MLSPHLNHLSQPSGLQNKSNGWEVLDYSHFICQGYTQSEVDILIPYTRHVHLRQVKMDFYKPNFKKEQLEGTIKFSLVLDNLRIAGFDGYLSVEYVN